MMKLRLVLPIFILVLASIFVMPTIVYGQSCEREGQCINNQECTCNVWNNRTCVSWSLGGDCGSAVIGSVEVPAGVSNFTQYTGGFSEIGLLHFLSRMVQLVTIIAGVLVMFNFIKAGWMFLVAADNTKAAGEVRDTLTFSVIGLVIIAITYTIAALIGLLFFGDARFILQPELYSALGP